ncbi:hypothetical protein, partial [Actinomadura darangshiensis]|uniref:hypothetical protein n=1 Tax=Actinomadura darangshiensis TaxID=705336 RepID=UPI001A9F50CD
PSTTQCVPHRDHHFPREESNSIAERVLVATQGDRRTCKIAIDSLKETSEQASPDSITQRMARCHRE